MKKLCFLTMARLRDIGSRGIYTDLIRKARDNNWNVYIVTPRERSLAHLPWSSIGDSELEKQNGVYILHVNTLNLQETSIIEKGISILLLECQFKKAIKNNLGDIKFDLITYSTPPITFTNVVKYLKKKNPQAITYLQLKDIFPQNAVDIGLLQGKPVQGSWFKVHGWVARGKYLLYKYFRKKEKELYKVSDYIGCMSPANVDFVLKHNPEIREDRVEVAPNSVDLNDNLNLDEGQEKAERYYIRKKYDLPTDKPIFIYGGNLGKPQGIDFLVKCLEANKRRTDCYFVVVGSGTEYPRLEAWYNLNVNLNDNEVNTNYQEFENSRISVKVMQGLPKADYDLLVKHCDVGMIFLDHRFTIPNYPSRLLSYLENKMPVICATDPNTDIGSLAEANGYGYWCESVKPEDFTALVDKMLKSDRKAMGEKGYQFLKENYLVAHTYNAIMSHFNEHESH